MEIDIPVAPSPTIEFKTKAKPGQKMNVDLEAGTIDDVIIIEVGEAEGHGFNVEESFLEALVKYVRKDLGGRLQCNGGHQWDSLFFQLGRFDNVRLSDDRKKVIGNLSTYKAADKSPVIPGMATWVLEMAEEDPQSIMCSIKFKAAGFYQYDPKGNKVYIQDSWYGPVKQFKDKPCFAEFQKVYSCDIVDDGALTSSLFSEGSQAAARQFGELLKTPGFMEFFRENEDQFPQLQSYFHDKYKVSIPKLFKSLFSNHKEEMEDPKPTPSAAPVETSAAAVTTDLSAQIADALKPLQDELASFKTALAAKDAEIEKLKAQPAATPTGVKSDSASRVEASAEKSYHANPINIKARGFQPVKN